MFRTPFLFKSFSSSFIEVNKPPKPVPNVRGMPLGSWTILPWSLKQIYLSCWLEMVQEGGFEVYERYKLYEISEILEEIDLGNYFGVVDHVNVDLILQILGSQLFDFLFEELLKQLHNHIPFLLVL